MKSIVPRRRLRPPCWRRWRKGKLRLPGKLVHWTLRFSYWLLKTRLNSRALILCPKLNSTVFFSTPVIQYLSTEDEIKMVSETTGTDREESQPVLETEDILTLQSLVRQVPAPENVVAYAVALATATRPQAESCDEWTSKRVKWEPVHAGAQALILAAKARALLAGRANASREGVKAMANPALRHRVLPSFFAESEGLGSDEIVEHLLETVSS